MYVLVEEYNKDFEYDLKYRIICTDLNFEGILKMYDLFLDLKISIFKVPQEKFKYFGMSMRIIDTYFNPGHYDEVLIKKNY